jgi:ubiquitin C-terminal hydrolase
MFIKDLFIKFENSHFQPNYNKKNKNNKNNKVLFAEFIILINNFRYIILNRFI